MTSSVLASHPPSSTHQAAPVSVTPISLGGERPCCTYCHKLGHLVQICYKKQRDTPHRNSHSSYNNISSETKELLTFLRRMNASAQTGSASSVAPSSSNERTDPTTPSSSGSTHSPRRRDSQRL